MVSMSESYHMHLNLETVYVCNYPKIHNSHILGAKSQSYHFGQDLHHVVQCGA